MVALEPQHKNVTARRPWSPSQSYMNVHRPGGRRFSHVDSLTAPRHSVVDSGTATAVTVGQGPPARPDRPRPPLVRGPRRAPPGEAPGAAHHALCQPTMFVEEDDVDTAGLALLALARCA